MSSRVTKTNPYLRNAKLRARMVLRSVESSSAIEGIRKPFETPRVRKAVSQTSEPARFPARRRGKP